MIGVVGLAMAYVVGSFPSAYIAGRMLKGIDLRTFGSGNLGTTNVYREIGLGPAIVVLLVDAAKGALPVVVLPALLGVGFTGTNSSAWWAIAFGVAAIAGHAKPIFLLWNGGGKGVATAAGVFLALTPMPALAALAAFVAIVAFTRFVSLASMIAVLTLPALEWFDGGASPVFLASIAVALFVVWAHRTNLVRLRSGTEPRLGRPAGGTP